MIIVWIIHSIVTFIGIPLDDYPKQTFKTTFLINPLTFRRKYNVTCYFTLTPRCFSFLRLYLDKCVESDLPFDRLSFTETLKG